MKPMRIEPCVYSEDGGQTVFETKHKVDNEGFCATCGMQLTSEEPVEVPEDDTEGYWIVL